MAKRSAGYDVVIVGGAIIGSAVAYFLTADESFQGRVLVIEKDPSYQYCSTTRSLASIRQQFSTPVNIHLSQFGVEFLRTVKDRLGTDVEVSFREAGYLLLASEQADSHSRPQRAGPNPAGRGCLSAGSCRIAGAFPVARNLGLGLPVALGCPGKAGLMHIACCTRSATRP